MALNYTKLFTVIGKLLYRLNQNYAYIATNNTDLGTIDAVLVAQSLSRMIDSLDTNDLINGYSDDVVTWTQNMIDRISRVLTDGALVTDNFSFGSAPDVQTVLEAIIADMVLNGVTVQAPTITIGSVTKSTYYTNAGNMKVGSTLDGATPPTSGANANRAYLSQNSYMVPDDETLTFTCVQDSENGAQRGNELFNITGTGAGSDPYSAVGENVGSLGTINVQDANASTYANNPSFDSWSSGAPNGWTVTTGAGGTDFQEETTDVLIPSSSAFVTIQSNNHLLLTQTLQPSLFTRTKAYFLTAWARKKTNAATSQNMSLVLSFGSTVYTLPLTLSGTTWTLSSKFFTVPIDIDGNVTLVLQPNSAGVLATANDPTIIDNIVIQPANYFCANAYAITGGQDKFIIGDTFSQRVQNDGSAAKFYTLFRKAFKVQLNTASSSPSISEGLVV